MRTHPSPGRVILQSAALVAVLAVAAHLAGCAGEPDPSAQPADGGSDRADGAEEVVPGSPADLLIGVDTSAAVTVVDAWFLSFTLDTSRAVPAPGGQPYDFDRPRLRRMAGALAPGWWRVGGTRADEVFVDLSDTPVTEPPEGYGRVLTRATWNDICDFARDLDLRLLYTLNAGPGPRDAEQRWTADNARELLADVAASDCPVGVWELGNEINGFVAAFGLDAVIDGAQYADDMAVARALVDELTPEVALAGPASAFWPVWGEVGPILPDFLALGGDRVDIVTWHYYPQQSSSCAIASRRAALETLLDPAALDELHVWAEHVETHAAGTSVWLGETSHAQCGGQPEVSDRYVTGFWWLDQLGALARRGQPVVMRQTLTGGTYSLIDHETLEPRPDYFTSVLWRRLMGPRVLDVTVEPGQDRGEGEGGEADLLRVYGQCTPGRPGGVTLAVVHLGLEAVTIGLPDSLGATREVYLLTASELASPTLELNGVTLAVDEDGGLPTLQPADAVGNLVWPARSYGFVVLPDAAAGACP